MNTTAAQRVPLSDCLESNIKMIETMTERPDRHKHVLPLTQAVCEQFADTLVPTYKLRLCVALTQSLSVPDKDREANLESRKLAYKLWTEAIYNLSPSLFEDAVEHGCKIAEYHLRQYDLCSAHYVREQIRPFVASSWARHRFGKVNALYSLFMVSRGVKV